MVLLFPTFALLFLLILKAANPFVIMAIVYIPSFFYIVWVRLQLAKDPRFREALKNRAKRMKPMVKKRDFMA